MENRIGVVGIVIDDPKKSAESVNELLSDFSDIIIGRMGIPYEKRSICIISVMVDGTNDRIGALCGKLGRLEGVNAKSVLSTKIYKGE
ncbi:MAG: CopG family transcriptional regulator [Clostridiales bacterium]|nr:CopG family transcriptional regulator [Clostridiales bacterium]